MNNYTQQRGVTFIEIMVYVALLTLISTGLIMFTVSSLKATNSAKLASAVNSNARGALNVMTRTIRQGKSVYTPTSLLDDDAGQLSIVSASNPPTDETETYVDFYLDDERLYMKTEGQTAVLITSEQVKVSQLRFSNLNQASDASAVQIIIEVEPANASSQVIAEANVSLTTTASFRSY